MRLSGKCGAVSWSFLHSFIHDKLLYLEGAENGTAHQAKLTPRLATSY